MNRSTLAVRRAVGLMSGTALDGEVDVAVLETDGLQTVQLLAFEAVALPPVVMNAVEDAVAKAREWAFLGEEPQCFAQAETLISEAQSEALLAVLNAHGIAASEVDVVGFHGQTVLHRPASGGRAGATRQLGDGALMARRVGIDVVNDFRSADIAAGGQGAPLAPIYHAARLASLGQMGGRCGVLNLGGVANLTAWFGSDLESPETQQLLALDTGPANAPLDDLCRQRGIGRQDLGGERALRGRVDESVLESMLQDPWFDRPAPKSLDRYSFGINAVVELDLDDALATMCAFSASAVQRALCKLPLRLERLLVCGGGRHNKALMAALQQRCDCIVESVDAVGWNGDAIEAECFAYLAVRHRHRLPLSFPGTTGVAAPCLGGRCWPAV